MKAVRRRSRNRVGRVGAFLPQVDWGSAIARCLVAIGATVFLLTLISPAKLMADSRRAAKRVDAAAMVLRDTLSGSDRGIPHGLLKRAECVGVFPSVWKGALGFGGKYGKGVVSCRTAAQDWSAPATFRIEGGNVGFQIGGSSTDLVLVFLGKQSIKKLLRTSFTIGVDGAAAAGPVGRSASGNTDILLRNEILTYARSRGLFAGVAFDGATLRPAHGANRSLYGFDARAQDILRGDVKAPPAADELLRILSQYAPEKKASD